MNIDVIRNQARCRTIWKRFQESLRNLFLVLERNVQFVDRVLRGPVDFDVDQRQLNRQAVFVECEGLSDRLPNLVGRNSLVEGEDDRRSSVEVDIQELRSSEGGRDESDDDQGTRNGIGEIALLHEVDVARAEDRTSSAVDVVGHPQP